MAKVDNILFCLKSVSAGNQGVSANVILSAITPEYIPGLFSFSVIVSLLDLDCNGMHTFSVEFVDPNGNKIVNIDKQQLPIKEEESNLPNEYKGINIAMDWNNVVFKTSGLYSIVIYYDDEKIASKTIYAKGKNE